MNDKAVAMAVTIASLLAAVALSSPVGRRPVAGPPLHQDQKPAPLPKTHGNQHYSVTLKWVKQAEETPPSAPEETNGPSAERHREAVTDPRTAQLPVVQACFEIVSHCDPSHELSLTDIRLPDASAHVIPNALPQRQTLPSGTVHADGKEGRDGGE